MDSGSVASPNRETENMLDGSDVISDWPILNALLNTANGATWVNFHDGGGVGIGYSQHSGMAILADGTAEAGVRIARTLWNDLASGVMRHADAGYEIAVVPMAINHCCETLHDTSVKFHCTMSHTSWFENRGCYRSIRSR